MSFIVMLSKERFYESKESTEKINAVIVIKFIQEILQTNQKALNIKR